MYSFSRPPQDKAAARPEGVRASPQGGKGPFLIILKRGPTSWPVGLAQCKRVEMAIRKRRLLFAGAVQGTHNERLTRRMMFGTMAGGENPGPGRREKNWVQCLVGDPRVLRATEGIHGTRPFRAWRRNGSMAYGG